MSIKLKSLSVNLSIVTVSTLLALLLAEGVVRISKLQADEQTHQQLFVEHDPLLGWRKIPNATGIHETSEYTVEETFNSKGLRGPEYPYEKSEQEYRILVLGDSFAEGYTVSFEELFSEVLKRRLVHPGKQVEVINAGTAGYSTDQEVLFFSQEGKKYAPDLTILLFYQNDVWFNGQTDYWRGFKPRFDIAEGGDLSISGVPVPSPESSKARTREEHAEDWSFRSLKNWLREHSHLYSLVAVRVNNSPSLKAMAVKVGLVDDSESEIPKVFEVFQTEYSHEFVELWHLTEALLLGLKDDTASIGGRLLIFYVPFRASIYHDEWEEMERRYGMEKGAWDPEQPGIALRNICERHGMECLDPTEDFKKSVERLYFREDGHWNSLGHRVVGETLAEYIAKHHFHK